MSPEVASKIALWRARIADGQELSIEEQAEAIRILRADRVGAAVASETSRRKKAKAEIPTAADLLSELGDL